MTSPLNQIVTKLDEIDKLLQLNNNDFRQIIELVENLIHHEDTGDNTKEVCCKILKLINNSCYKNYLYLKYISTNEIKSLTSALRTACEALKKAEKRFSHIEDWHRDYVTPDNFKDCQEMGQTPESYLRAGKNECRQAEKEIAEKLKVL